MRIAINALDFNPGKMGGVETYLRNLWYFLQKVSEGDDYTLLSNEWNLSEFTLENPRFSVKTCNYNKRTFRRLLRSILKKSIRYDILRAEPRYLDYDIIHHPFTFMSTNWYEKPSVLTFMDMQHEFYPGFFSQSELEFRRKNYLPSAQMATRIISISEYSKRCLVERFQIDPNKIDVVHLGYGQQYRMLDDSDQMKNIQHKYSLHRPFLYYPAATWPHKNHITLLKSLRLIVDRFGFDGELILTGIAMNAHDDILKEIDALKLSTKVRVLGYLDKSELPYLYNLARFLVFPSLFEGFGIPLVEAMACGCPVVCSSATSLPEVLGNAGVMFDPTSVEEMTERLWLVWNDDTMRKEMSASGIERVKQFSWENACRATLDVYKKVLT
jgi:glycosyltransferase involved in cell wall biosynthesis